MSEEQEESRGVRIRVIGLGGAGSNIVGRLHPRQIEGTLLSILDSDMRSLELSKLTDKVLIGQEVIRGMGTGGDPEIAKQAVAADLNRITELVSGVDLVFLIAGLGGGLGSGATPLVAKAAHQAGALVISFITLPFTFEGNRRYQIAESAWAQIREQSHAVVALPNDGLLQQCSEGANVQEVFTQADLWIQGGISSIWAMLNKRGLVNLDFAALRSVFPGVGGKTLFSIAEGRGENYIEQALESLMQCPLLHLPESRYQTDHLLVNLVSGPDLGMAQVNSIMTQITEKFASREHTRMGAVIEEGASQTLRICVMGCSDMGNEHYRQTQKNQEVGSEVFQGQESSPLSKISGKSRKRNPASSIAVPATDYQEEFGFMENESKGYFEKSANNLWNGEDLDLPTFQRKGVKIHL